MKWPRHVTVEPVRNGRGIVALKAFRKGERVCSVDGRVITAARLWRMWDTNPRGAANCFRFDAEHYLDPQDRVGAFANHSCMPNAGIFKERGALVMRAVRAISAGAEVTHDYSTLLGCDDVWTMKCNCGERACRGVVRNIASLPPAAVRKYRRMGAIPAYVLAD